jgi:hypothetical protein
MTLGLGIKASFRRLFLTSGRFYPFICRLTVIASSTDWLRSGKRFIHDFIAETISGSKELPDWPPTHRQTIEQGFSLNANLLSKTRWLSDYAPLSSSRATLARETRG